MFVVCSNLLFCQYFLSTTETRHVHCMITLIKIHKFILFFKISHRKSVLIICSFTICTSVCTTWLWTFDIIYNWCLIIPLGSCLPVPRVLGIVKHNQQYVYIYIGGKAITILAYYIWHNINTYKLVIHTLSTICVINNIQHTYIQWLNEKVQSHQ